MDSDDLHDGWTQVKELYHRQNYTIHAHRTDVDEELWYVGAFRELKDGSRELLGDDHEVNDVPESQVEYVMKNMAKRARKEVIETHEESE